MESPSQPETAPVPKAESSSNRYAFLDWTRGLAAVIMLQGHVFHSFSRSDLRQQDAFILSQFIGGLPPAIFLFLTGVTLAFLMESRERQGLPGWDRVTAALRRAGYLFVLAILFRLQLWLFAFPQSDWSNLFRVDILNCMGFGIAVMSLMALFNTMERVRLCAILGLAIAAGAPLVSLLDTNSLHPFVRAYFVPSLDSFSFFPWAAFLAFGLSAGSVLRLASKQMQQVMQWAAWFGVVLIIAAQYFSNLPYSLYPKSDFWLNSPGLVLIKLGVILVLSSFAYLWTTYLVTGWSWVRQLGTTSLLIYWTHTELVYGRWLGALKESLTTVQTLAMAVGVIALMLGISTLRTRWKQVREFLFNGRTGAPVPETE